MAEKSRDPPAEPATSTPASAVPDTSELLPVVHYGRVGEKPPFEPGDWDDDDEDDKPDAAQVAMSGWDSNDLFPDINQAAEAYKKAFGDVPTIMCLMGDSVDKAAELLMQAVEQNTPFTSDAEWYAALGIDPPPDDALI